MIIYGTIERQVFTRRRAVWHDIVSKHSVTAKDNGDGTATVWFAYSNGSVEKFHNVPLEQIEFLND